MDINKAYQLIVNKLMLWLRDFVKLLPNIAIAALILVLGFYVSKWIKKDRMQNVYPFHAQCYAKQSICFFGVYFFAWCYHFCSA